jgi:5-methylcytosine-specific restriction endonuclease McrA
MVKVAPAARQRPGAGQPNAEVDVPEGSKRCTRCGEVKGFAAFSKNRTTADGLQQHCKACNRAYYLARQAYILAREKARRERLGDEIRARQRAEYWRDVERSRAQARASAAIQNPKRRDYKQAWARADRAKYPEKWRAKYRRERVRDPMRYKAIAYKRRAAKKQMPRGTVTAVGLAARWDYYGGRCWMCGGPAVEFDHVKPLKHSGTHCHANLRPACVPCNRRKQAIWPFPGAGLT